MNRLALLRARADMLQRARNFFAAKDILEVDCPLITAAASVDTHIDLIQTVHPSGHRFLHSSPEYAMKRLLAEGIGDIYQLGHVFRQEETGVKHNPEFTMAEWYRLELTFEDMIRETFEFCHLFLGDVPTKSLTYRQAFQEFAGIDPFTATKEKLIAHLQAHRIPMYAGLEDEGKDALLNLILAYQVEPYLGQEHLCALKHYPCSQAALARTTSDGEFKVAERFEIYYKGIELANGYRELLDSKEQESRLHEANLERQQLGKNSLPIDRAFLKALEKGLPECCGVAVGFDRLLMLQYDQNSLSAVLPFDWHTI